MRNIISNGIGSRWMNQGGSALLPETLAYKTRVESDGGQIIDIIYVNDCYKLIKSEGILSQGLIWISPNAGLKKDGSNKVSKVYNLFGENDAVSTVDGTKPIYVASGVQYNKKSYFNTIGKVLDFINIALPLHNDIFWGMETPTTTTSTMWFQHGTGVNPANGFQHYGGGRWLAATGGAFHYSTTTPAPQSGINCRRFYNQRYNSTLGLGNVYTDNVLNTNSSISGTFKANQINTQTLNILRTAPATLSDYVIFSALSASSANSIRSYLVDTYKQINIIFDGNSLTQGAYASENMAYPDQLYTSIKVSNNLSKGIEGYNFGVGGQKIDAMAADAATQIDTLFISGSILVGWEIVNQWSTTDKDLVYQKYRDYFLARKAAGFKCIACTAIDQQYYPKTNWTTESTYINDLIKTNFPALGIHVVDLASDTRLMSALDTTYFQPDKIHLTDVGYKVVADMVLLKIIEII